MSSLFFDLKLSNETIASVSIRQFKLGLHAYEVTANGQSFRGTVEWEWEDEHSEPLELVSRVLNDYWSIHKLTSSAAHDQDSL
jgi:hypothetical protein